MTFGDQRASPQTKKDNALYSPTQALECAVIALSSHNKWTYASQRFVLKASSSVENGFP